MKSVRITLPVQSVKAHARPGDASGTAWDGRVVWGNFMRSLAPFKTLLYRGTSLIRKRTLLGPYRRPMLRVLRGF